MGKQGSIAGLGARIWDRMRDPGTPLSAALLIMLAAGFVMPTGAAWSDVFYVVSGPLVLLAFWRGAVAGDWFGPAFYWPVLLILWSCASVFWSEDHLARDYKFLGEGFLCLVFYTGLVAALRLPDFARLMGNVLIGFGTLNAVIAEVLYPWRNGLGGRLAGFGETRQMVLGASVIAVAALFALARVLTQDPRAARRRGLHLACALLMILFVVLTQSRGPLLGLIAGILVLAAASRWRWWLLPPLLLVPALLLGLMGPVRRLVVAVLTARGESARPEIWRATLGRIIEHPWIGHGVGATLGFQDFTFPHDLYLSLVFYSGVVGLALFAAVAWRLLGGVIARPGAERALLIALWANMLVSGLTDYGQIIKGPSALWYIIWLPIAFSTFYVTHPQASVIARLRGASVIARLRGEQAR
jgi:O-antigen ligase